MPEMHFRVKWPNGKVDNCYSPSYVIADHLVEGESYAVSDFMERVQQALQIASERVRERYGFVCSSALDQLASIEATAGELSAAERQGRVEILDFEKHAPRDARAK
jgi:uncharacterized repeat protein (TIGR04042 family)